MYTVFPNLARKCVKNYQLPGTDIVIEKDDVIIVPAFAIHRDEQYFPQPDKFNPDRFDVDSAAKAQLDRVYLPFGTGPRNCIGLRLVVLSVL